MNLKYFTNEITNFLNDDIVTQTGRVWEVYIYDEEVGHHLCDIRPAYECHPVHVITENRVDDDLEADLLDCDHDPRYFYCRGVKGRDFPHPDRDPDDSDEEYLEQVLEYARANCGMFEVAP